MNNTKRCAPLLGKETAMNLGILKDGEEAVITSNLVTYAMGEK